MVIQDGLHQLEKTRGRKGSKGEEMKVCVEIVEGLYGEGDICFDLRASLQTQEDTIDKTGSTWNCPSTPILRSTLQIQRLHHHLKSTFPLLLFPVSPPTASKFDNGWQDEWYMRSVHWRTQRYFDWILSKSEVNKSEVFQSFLDGNLFAECVSEDASGIIGEVLKVVTRITRIGDTLTSTEEPNLDLSDQKKVILDQLNDRSDSIRELLDALQRHFMCLRNLSRITDEVSRCTLDVASFSFSNLEESNHASCSSVELITERCDRVEGWLSKVSSELEEVLGLQLKESKESIFFIMASEEVVDQELNWYFEQCDKEISKHLRHVL